MYCSIVFILGMHVSTHTHEFIKIIILNSQQWKELMISKVNIQK